MLKTLLAGVGIVAIAGASAVALHAGYDDGYRSRSLAVNYAGLDLTSPAGIALLQDRVERAVRRVCDGSGDSFYDNGDERQCRHPAAAAGGRGFVRSAHQVSSRSPNRASLLFKSR